VTHFLTHTVTRFSPPTVWVGYELNVWRRWVVPHYLAFSHSRWMFQARRILRHVNSPLCCRCPVLTCCWPFVCRVSQLLPCRYSRPFSVMPYHIHVWAVYEPMSIHRDPLDLKRCRCRSTHRQTFLICPPLLSLPPSTRVLSSCLDVVVVANYRVHTVDSMLKLHTMFVCLACRCMSPFTLLCRSSPVWSILPPWRTHDVSLLISVMLSLCDG
jgi:hypothetical protein